MTFESIELTISVSPKISQNQFVTQALKMCFTNNLQI